MICVVLDDDESFCDRFEEFLRRRFDATVACFLEYEKCLEYLRECSLSASMPDFLFVDLKLDAGRDGIVFVEQLRAEQITVPSVILTGYDGPEPRDRAAKTMSTVIPKDAIENGEEGLLRDVCLFSIVNWSRERKLSAVNLRDEGHQVLALSAEIAHEMRSVINAIDQQIALVKLLQQQNMLTPEKFSESASMVNKRVSTGRYFTDLLLTYQRREHRPKKRMTNVRTALLDAFEEFHLKEKILFNAEFEDIGTRLVEGELIKSIMQILLKNAVDHCGAGVAISVSLRSEGSMTSTWTIIDVQDDGPGIAPENRERIFRPGDRAGKQIKYVDGGGLGLGLGFARYLAERHRGHARPELAGTVRCVNPKASAGARFRIMLPD